jgi:hypothetical protein
MRKSKSRQREREREHPLRASPTEMGAKPAESKYRRAGFFLRLSTHGIDIAIALTPLYYFIPAPNGYVMIFVIWTYYFACDMFLQRTIGKIFTGMFYLTKDEQPLAPGAIANRGFLRFLLFLGVLSWRKTTLVDLFSGSRVFQMNPPPKKALGPPQSRRQFKTER